MRSFAMATALYTRHVRTTVRLATPGLLILLAAAGCGSSGHKQSAIGPRLLTSAVSGARGPATNGLIVFSSCGYGGAQDLFVIKPDGSGRRRLTRTPISEEDPAWSPDGKQIAYDVSRGETVGLPEALYVMNGDGTGKHVLVPPGNNIVFNPVWSPDGKMVAFIAEGESDEVHVVNVAGGEERALVQEAGAFSWSRDGKRIAFSADGAAAANKEIFEEIFVANADGTALKRLTRNRLIDNPPVWSPDGKTIAFVRGDLNPPPTDIFVVNADGMPRERKLVAGLTLKSGDDELVVRAPPGQTTGDVDWSPDGTKLAFLGGAADSFDLDVAVVKPNGHGRHLVTHDGGVSSFSWQPVPRSR